MITEIRTAAKLALHLTKLRDAAARLGFSPLVTGALSLAAAQAATEVRQAACDHQRTQERAINTQQIRATAVVCESCQKTLSMEDARDENHG